MEEVGPDVSILARGDLVVPTVRRPDRCPSSGAGQEDMCLWGQHTERGIRRAHGYAVEAFVEHERFLVAVPAWLRPVAVLLEPLSIVEKTCWQAFKAQERLPWQPARAPVLGAGPLRLLGALVLLNRGLEVTVYSLESPSSRRARLAREAGARYEAAGDRSMERSLGESVGRDCWTAFSPTASPVWSASPRPWRSGASRRWPVWRTVMPRDLPLGNGRLLVAFDSSYQMHELYWPRVGGENHLAGHPCRLGLWLAQAGEARFRWLDDPGWRRELVYEPETLVTHVSLQHPDLPLTMVVSDAVDFHEDLLVRRFDLASEAATELEARLFLHHDFHISGTEVGDTAYYEPERRAVFHYKGQRWFVINAAVAAPAAAPWPPAADTAPGLTVGVHQWACGYKELGGLQGTWRDAEDGLLSGAPIAQGSVDSTVGVSLTLSPGQTRTLYAWLGAGETFDAVSVLDQMCRQRGPQGFLDRIRSYWHLWLRSHRPGGSALPGPVERLYRTSLLVARTQVDEGGGILAANDSDAASAVRDTYSYVWPRDGALVAGALIACGYIDLPRAFFRFCARVLAREGYLLHKFNPDGSLGSSWHPWLRGATKAVPLQEDETALVLWALWEHFSRHHDVEFIKPLYRDFICRAADFLERFRDPITGLPEPSYDLWEERFGVHAWTVGAVWAGLRAGARFAAAFGETERVRYYERAAEELRAAIDRLWDAGSNRFLRSLVPSDEGAWAPDGVVDASVAGLWKFGLLDARDTRVVSTMDAVRERLWVRTPIGGLARYEGDAYHRVTGDDAAVPGNPWFICTLWLAEWHVAVARELAALEPALDLLSWVAAHALPSGVLAEQVHPYTGEPLSVSPLTWSHGTFIAAVHAYRRALERMRGSEQGRGEKGGHP